MAVVFPGSRPVVRPDSRRVLAGGVQAPGLGGQILQAMPGPGMDHPIHHGGPVDRMGGFDRYSAGPMSGGTGLAHAIMAGNAKTRPVNPANRGSSGGIFALLAASAQRAMEQKAQMSGAYGAGAQARQRALQLASANLHAGGVQAPY